MHAKQAKGAKAAEPAARAAGGGEVKAASLTRLPRWALGHGGAGLGAPAGAALPVQPKLTINQPGDAYEQEADQVANQVMRMPDQALRAPAPMVQRACACGGTAGPDGECEACKAQRMSVQRQVADEERVQRQADDEEEQIQRRVVEEDEAPLAQLKPANSGSTVAPPSVHHAIRGPGRPLDAGARAFLEPRFGQDFGHVRVHTGQQAAASARAINARAYTVGREIVFAAGQYTPSTGAGQQLLAHELAHVVQQGQGRASGRLQRKADIPDYEGRVRDISKLKKEANLPGWSQVRACQGVSPPEGGKAFSDYCPVVLEPGTNVTVRESFAGGGWFHIEHPPAESLGGQRFGFVPALYIERAPVSKTATAVPATQEPYEGPGWSRVNQLGIVRVEEDTATVRGARLRVEPSTDKAMLRHLSENTRVFVVAENKTAGWIYVNVVSSADAGMRGYVSDALVWRSLPDPAAQLYYVAEQGLGLQKLVENHPQYKSYDIRTGDDARSLVMAVLIANDQDSRTKGHVYLNEKKLKEANDAGLWEGALDVADKYRRVLRPLFQSVEILHGTKIWLPGSAYVQSLKGKGIIPTRSDWKNAAIAITKGVGGFVVGLVEGIVRSVVDVFVGIYDLVKSVVTTAIDLISGALIEKAKDIIDTIAEMLKEKSPSEVAADLMKALKDAVTQMLSDMFNDFVNRWNSNNVYNAWHFRGMVVGYILAEVLMAIFSGGSVTAVKWLGKLGKFGGKLAKVLMKVFDKIDDVFSKLPGRKPRSKGTPNKDVTPDKADAGSDKAKQFALAMTLAQGIAEMHDKKDSPVTLAVAFLLPLKTRFKWIDKFTYKKLSAGHYQILMYASPPHYVDRDYTTEILKDQEEAAKKGVKDKQPEGTHGEIDADTARIKYVHDRGVESGKITAAGEGLSPTNPATKKGWDNPYEFDGPFGKGIDDIMFDKHGNPVLLEYKGGRSELGPGQMGKDWVCRKIRQLAQRNDPMAAMLTKAMEAGTLTGRLYRTPVDDVGAAGTTFRERDWTYSGKC